MKKEIKRLTEFTHLKTGKPYEYLGSCINATNGDADGQEMVMYRRLGEDQVYVRESKEFFEKFEKKFKIKSGT